MILDTSEICNHINSELATFIYNIIRVIKLGVPIILVLMGILDFAKGVYASKEDESTKAQKDFIKRIIAGAAVFLMITLTQLVINVIDKKSNGEIWACANRIMNGEKNTSSQQYVDIKSYCCETSGGEFEGRTCKLTQQQVTEYNECLNNNRK